MRPSPCDNRLRLLRVAQTQMKYTGVGYKKFGSRHGSRRNVHMGPENQKAYVLWSAYPAYIQAAQTRLTQGQKHLRAAVARRIQIRRMPLLEFRHDSLTDEQAELENLLDSLKAERESEQAGGEEEHWFSEGADGTELDPQSDSEYISTRDAPAREK